MAHRHFEGLLHAQLYGKYRPVPPSALIKRVVEYLEEKHDGSLNTAVDVGCGSGQSTGFFSSYFKAVIGTDISSAQISNAEKANQLPNVKFEVSPAEKINVPDGTVQLVSACQAAHWFDLPKFYAEAYRALSSNGVLALYGYEFPVFVTGNAEKDAKLDARLQKFYSVETGGYWDEFRKYVDRKYVDRVFEFGNEGGEDKGYLFRDFKREEGFNDDRESTLADIVNYCSTWSGYQNYLKQHGEEQANGLMRNYEKELIEIFGTGNDPEKIQFTRRIKYFLLMGRK